MTPIASGYSMAMEQALTNLTLAGENGYNHGALLVKMAAHNDLLIWTVGNV